MKKNFNIRHGFILLYVLILSYSYFQSTSQHWSSVIDFDLTVIYNSLQLISGLDQDYREHPAYTQFMFYGLSFKILSFFNSNIITSVEQLLTTDSPNDSIGSLFLIARFVNSIFLIITIFYFSKICKLFDIKKQLIFFGAVSLAISQSGIENLIILRADIIAIALMMGSIFYILSFIKLEHRPHKILLASIFLVLSLLAKIQIIILLILVFVLVPFIISSETNKKLNYSVGLRYYNFYLVSYAFIFMGYLVLQYFIHNHERFEDQKYIDFFIFLIFNITMFFYLLFLNFKKKDSLKISLSIFILLLFGMILTVGSLLTLSYLEIFKLSPYILMRLVNPFYYLKVYSPLSSTSIEFSFLKDLISLFFSGLKIDIKSLLSLCVIMLYSLVNNLNNNNKKDFWYQIIFFVSTMLIIFVFNMRYFKTYDMFYLPIYYVLINLCLKNLQKYFLISVVLVVFIFNNNFFIKKYDLIHLSFQRESNINKICSDQDTRKFIWWWARKLDENFFRNLCEKENIILTDLRLSAYVN